MSSNSAIQKLLIINLLIVISMISGCKQHPDKEELKLQILELHQKLIEAHLKKDPNFFTQGFSDDFISVRNGEISEPSTQEILANIKDYINNTTFSEYRDVREPIIGFSNDGSIAWSIVQVKVKGDRDLEDGTVRKVDFICAWLTLYEKSDEGWNVRAEVSTFR